MARSYRKNPVWKDHNKGMKQIANRKVRRALRRNHEISLSHKSYRKYFSSYDICDYCSLIDRDFKKYYQKQIDRWYRWQDHPYLRGGRFPDEKECYREWMNYRGK